MEAYMRASLTLTFGICALAAAVFGSAAANAEPYFNRYNDGSWTNAEFNDGTCHYYYGHNAYDSETHVYRYGDCSHIAIGPAGEAIAVVPGPVALVPY
jgi:hypothetical protein